MSGSAGTLEMGATLVPQGVRFRVWAPGRRRVAVELYGASVQRLPLAHEGQGVWSALLPGGGPGLRYKYRLDDDAAFPDPYSRSQPEVSTAIPRWSTCMPIAGRMLTGVAWTFAGW